MKSTFCLIPLLLAAALIPACRTAGPAPSSRAIEGLSNPSIHVLFDHTRPLPVSGTFGWGAHVFQVGPELKVDLALAQDRIQRALLGGLPEEGLTFSEADPDFLVGFALAAGDALDERELNRAYGTDLNFPVRTGDAAPLQYRQGVLVVDLVERSSRRLLWRGAIQADIDTDFAEKKKQARCDAVARELLRYYPNAVQPQ